jgi:hypothetical protein
LQSLFHACQNKNTQSKEAIEGWKNGRKFAEISSEISVFLTAAKTASLQMFDPQLRLSLLHNIQVKIKLKINSNFHFFYQKKQSFLLSSFRLSSSCLENSSQNNNSFVPSPESCLQKLSESLTNISSNFESYSLGMIESVSKIRMWKEKIERFAGDISATESTESELNEWLEREMKKKPNENANENLAAVLLRNKFDEITSAFQDSLSSLSLTIGLSQQSNSFRERNTFFSGLCKQNHGNIANQCHMTGERLLFFIRIVRKLEKVFSSVAFQLEEVEERKRAF